MKKKILSLLIAFALSSSLTITAFAEHSTLTIDGQSVQIWSEKAENGAVLIPINLLSETMGFDIYYLTESNVILVSNTEKAAAFSVDCISYVANGENKYFSVPPQIINDTVYVPIADLIYDGFGYSCSTSNGDIIIDTVNQNYTTGTNTNNSITTNEIDTYKYYAPSKNLYLYSNDGKHFLGSLTDNKFSTDSIWNEFGNYGNKFNSSSIWNEFGNYGSRYSNESAFNKYATNPPIIVDEYGNFVGYLTANKYLNNGYTIFEIQQYVK